VGCGVGCGGFAWARRGRAAWAQAEAEANRARRSGAGLSAALTKARRERTAANAATANAHRAKKEALAAAAANKNAALTAMTANKNAALTALTANKNRLAADLNAAKGSVASLEQAKKSIIKQAQQYRQKARNAKALAVAANAKANAVGANAAAKQAAFNAEKAALIANAEAKIANAEARAATSSSNANAIKTASATATAQAQRNLNAALERLKTAMAAANNGKKPITRGMGIMGAVANANANEYFNANLESHASNNSPWNKIVNKLNLNSNKNLKNWNAGYLTKWLKSPLLNANDQKFLKAELARRSFDAEYKQFMKVKNWAKFNSLVILKGRMEKALANIGNNNGTRRTQYNAFAPGINKMANRIAKVKAMKSAGELASYPDLVSAYNKGNYYGWNSKFTNIFTKQYNRFINANGTLKQSDMRPATGGASYGKGGVNYKDDIKSRYGSGGKIHIKTLKNGRSGYYMMTAPGQFWPIVNVSRNKATSKILYHINTAYPYNNARARQPTTQLGVRS
jgi:hypothetical protein